MFQYHCLNPISKTGLDLFSDQYHGRLKAGSPKAAAHRPSSTSTVRRKNLMLTIQSLPIITTTGKKTYS